MAAEKVLKKSSIPQLRPLTKIKHNSIFGTEITLLRIERKVNNSQ